VTKLRLWLILGLGALSLAGLLVFTVVNEHVGFAWEHDPWSRPVIVVQLASTAAAIIGGATMMLRRPSNWCGAIGVLLGVVFAAWWIASFAWGHAGGYRQMITYPLVYAVRPMLFWLVLAFPIGRLDRVSRRLFLVLLIGPLVALSVDPFVQGFAPWAGQPLVFWHQATWTLLVHSAWWDVGALLAAVAVLVVVRRRTLRFHGAGSTIAAPALWAAVVATVGDFFLLGAGPLRDLMNHGDGLTAFGSFIEIIDLGRWGLVVAILAVGARRSWPRERAGRRTIDLGSAPLDESLRSHVAHLLGDPTADVVVHDPVSGWIDLSGDARATPGADAAACVLTHDGEAVAAIEYDDAVAAHPWVVDIAVTAVALELESARQVALAQAREEELSRLAREVVSAEDAARRRLEHDLHDGAQQVLVGTTLQAALAERSGDGERELRTAIAEARGVLADAATGRPPALLAERGLHGALGALAVTAGVPVQVDVDACDDLPDALQSAIWYTAAEAVTNALKHASPSRLTIRLRRGRALTLTVEDDGQGGAPAAPAALTRRVDGAGGVLHVDSTRRGTSIVAHFPIGVEVGA
jgi:signal transduction histidine kinase